MKKIFCVFALTLFACAFVSCNNNTEVVEDTMVEETVDTAVVDGVVTLCVDTIL